MAWSIALAQRLKDVNCVVSTDDPGIAAVAQAFGAPVIDRPAELAGDETSMTKVVIHAAKQARAEGFAFDGVLLLQPTNPLRPLSMVESAIARFLGEPCELAYRGQPPGPEDRRGRGRGVYPQVRN